MRLRTWSTLHWLVLALVALMPDSALAEVQGADKPVTSLHLTSRGRFWLGGALSGAWSNDSSRVYGALDRYRIEGVPALTYFAADHIGIGFLVGGGREFARGAVGNDLVRTRSASSVLIGLQGAFEWPLTPLISVLFQPLVAYMYQWLIQSQKLRAGVERPFQNQIGQTYGSHELSYVRTALSTFLLFHVSRDVALGLGPMLWLDFIVRRSDRDLSLDAYPPDSSANASDPSTPSARRLQVGLSTMIAIAI